MMKCSAYLLIAAALSFRQVSGFTAWSSTSLRAHQARHSLLFGFPNPSNVNTNPKLVSGKSKKKPAKKNAADKASAAKVLMPHAPSTPYPNENEESILDRANQLLDTQEASKSPTRRIAEADFYQEPAKHYLQTLDKDVSVGPKPYATSIELLRDSKRRAQKLLSRSIFEKEKAEEKKAKIKARMEAELREVDNGLKMKLDMALSGIENDVERMQILINREMILEEERMAQFNALVQTLQSSVLAIQKDMATETKIYHEMKTLSSKLDRDSTSARQLGKLIVRKQELLDIESELLIDLKACASESKKAFLDCERRYKSMQSVLDTVCQPVKSLDSKIYDWSDIDIMESVLAEAANDVEQSEAKLTSLRERIEYALLQKDAILLDSVKMQQKSNENGSYNERISNASLSVSDFQGKNDTDVMKQLAVSLTNATLSGTKATAFALKTLIDAVSAKEFSMTADLARVKATQVSFGSNETFKETAREALDSIVDTTKVFFEKAAVSDASLEARQSVQNVTDELISAANAVTVLGKRAYQKLMNQED